MDNVNYYADGVTRVMTVLKDAFGDYFKGYFESTMDEIPESYLPCVMATSSNAQVISGATGTDNIAESLSLIVAINERDYLGADGQVNVADWHLRHLIYGQDPNTQEYIKESFMYVLRKHFTLNDGIVDNQIRINFYPGQRGEQVLTREAIISLDIERLALVPSRD